MDELIEKIVSAQRIALIAHIFPDGDAVGSLIGLSLALKQFGKEVFPVLHHPTPESFMYLCGEISIGHELPTSYEDTLLITLDLADAHRTGKREEVQSYADAHNLACIDHHPLGDLARKTPAYYHSLETSSCAELVYNLLHKLEARITPSIATALLTGMYTDTGGFQYSNTSTQTLEIGSELMKRGAKMRVIVDQTSPQKSISALRLLGIALERVTTTLNSSCTVTVISQDDMHTAGVESEDAHGGIVGQINVLPGSKCAVLLTEIEPGVIRGSIRAADHPGLPSVNITPIARLLGGGGHAKASGFMVNAQLVADETSPSGWRVT